MPTPLYHLHALTKLGPRPIGSPANQISADYIRENFRNAGLEVEEQPYTCTAWEHHSTLLEWKTELLDCHANPFSPACDVTAPIVTAGSLAELEIAPAKGKILLLYGDLVLVPVSPKSWFLKDECSERIVELLEALQPAALLAPPTGTDYYGTLTEDWELELPAATVPREVALRLVCQPESLVHLKIETRNIPATARNIIARTLNMPARRVVICAHFDTKINTPGALDNASGVAAMLTLAEKLPHLSLPFGLEFVAFNGEEYLPIGDDTYVRNGEGYFGQIEAAINFDGIGHWLASTSVTAMPGPESFIQKMQTIARDFPGVVWVEPWPESNHSTFAFRNIPAVAIGSSGARGVAHHPQDTAETISEEKLKEAITLGEKIVASL